MASGYWQADGDRALVRTPDGARVAYTGLEAGRPRSATSRWLSLEVTSARGTTSVPVEQRLRGLDDGFRALWYTIAAGSLPGEPHLVEQAVRVLLDALASWQPLPFATGLPTGIGVTGKPLRLYLPNYSQVTPVAGSVPEAPAAAPWTYQPLNAAQPVPDLTRVAAGGTAEHLAFVAAAARRGPTLRSGRRTVVLHGYGENPRIVVVYADEEIYTDCFGASVSRAGHLEVWSTAGGIGTRLQGSGLPPGTPTASGLDGAVEKFFLRLADRTERHRLRGRAAPHLADVPRAYVVRVNAALEESMRHLVLLSNEHPDLPRRIRLPSSILRAGHLPMTCLVARAAAPEAVDRDGAWLNMAFDPAPAPEPEFGPGPGAAFDPTRGVLVGPEGWSVTIEDWAEHDLLTPQHLRLRCHAAGLDWPVLVTRRDQRPAHEWSAHAQLLNRWQVDHDACLQAWRLEGNDGLPEAGAWDLLRQFLEDALLSWGDGPASGPAPQSVETMGGWYDGAWRDMTLRRLVGRRPLAARPGNPAPSPYLRSGEWTATSSGKRGPDGSRLINGGYLIHQDRDGMDERHDFMDLLHGGRRIRVRGVPGRVALQACWPVPVDAPPVRPTDRLGGPTTGGDAAPPSLAVWRELRDATESGLAAGEGADIVGAWVLGVFHPQLRRVTTLDQPVELADLRG